MYETVKTLTEAYLGKDAERFIGRQCKAHLKIEPTELKKENLQDLAKWVGISAALVIDRERADELKNAILGLKGGSN